MSMEESPDLPAKSINELEALKMQYIESFDFDKAKEVEEQIQKRNSLNYQETVDSAIKTFETDIEAIYNDFKNECQSIQDSSDQQEYQIRKQISEQYEKFKERHIEELNQLEKKYALNQIKVEKRPVVEADEIDVQSKKIAVLNDFEQAKRLHQKALDLRKKEIDKRRASVRSSYEDAKLLLIERQKSELQGLDIRLKMAIDFNQQKLDSNLKTASKAFKKKVASLEQKYLIETTSQFRTKKQKAEIGNSLQIAMSVKVQELTGDFIFTANCSIVNQGQKIDIPPAQVSMS